MAKFQVKVTSPGTNVVTLIKTLRLVADLGLGDAKHVADFLRDFAPCLLVAGIDREIADHAAALLSEAGADVAVEESNIDVPMLLCPEANHCYQWNWLSGATPLK